MYKHKFGFLFAPEDGTPQGGGDGSGSGDGKDGKAGSSGNSDEDEEGGDEDEEDESGLSKEEIAEAKKLFTALKDPKSARMIIKALADEAGYTGEGGKKEEKEVKDYILSALEGALGEHAFLAPKLGKAIKEILDHKEQESNERFERLNRENLQTKTNDAVKELKGQYADFKLFEADIVKLMDSIKPESSLSQKEYLRKLYKLAKLEKTEQHSRDQRRQQNRNDAGGRIPSNGGKGEKSKESAKPPEKISRRQAVEAAFETLSRGDSSGDED